MLFCVLLNYGQVNHVLVGLVVFAAEGNVLHIANHVDIGIVLAHQDVLHFVGLQHGLDLSLGLCLFCDLLCDRRSLCIHFLVGLELLKALIA